MLVITRSIGELFRIGNDIEILVADISGESAKLGITAPRDIAVHREEVYRKLTPSLGGVSGSIDAKKMESN